MGCIFGKEKIGLGFIEHDVPRDESFICLWVKAPISILGLRLTHKYAQDELGLKFIGIVGSGEGKT